MNGGLPESTEDSDTPKAVSEILAAVTVGKKQVATAVGWLLPFVLRPQRLS